MKPREAERDELFAAVCDGRATGPELERLEALLRDSPGVRDDYLAYLDLHACLVCDSVGEDAGGRLVVFQGETRKRVSRWWAPGIAAASLVLLITVLLRTGWFPGGAAEPCLAVVTNAEGALCEGTDASVMIGSGLGRGLLELGEGRLEFEMETGVRVALEGPARFELLGLNRAVLKEGRLSATVPPGGIGFTVDTPALALVDLGTQFGVHVTPRGEAEVHVFDGEVEAILPGAAPGRRKEILTTNLTCKAARNAQELEAVPYEPDHFPRLPGVSTGVEEVWGGVCVLRHPPGSVRRGTYQHDSILLFAEQRHVELEDPLEVSIVQPGSYRVGFDAGYGDRFRVELTPGLCVDSYLLHFDTKSSRQTTRRGTVRFRRPIVAVIAGGRQLARTDDLLGSWCTRYDREGAASRQLESDHVFIGSDRRTLTVNWNVGPAVDQVRVLVEGE